MLTGLFQNHIDRVSMPTLNRSPYLKAVKHGTRLINTPNIKLIYPDHLASGPLDWDKLPPCPASRLGRLKFGFYGC